MCDYFDDDFGDDFDYGDDFMDDDQLEESLEGDMDDPFDGESGLDDKPDQQDDDLTLDPFILGGAMGFAYEEGLRERKRKRLLKDESKRQKQKNSSEDLN